MKEGKPAITEKDFINSLITTTRRQICLCDALGWQTAHFRPAMLKDGTWRTAGQGDAKGFPDLVLVKPPRLIFSECKTDVGKLTEEQLGWLDVLSQCHTEVYLWRPEDLDEIKEILTLGHVPNKIEMATFKTSYRAVQEGDHEK